MKSRRGNEAEDTSKIICAGFGSEAAGDLLLDSGAANRSFSGIVGVRNAPIPGKSQYVVFEVAEAFQQTPEFALDPAAAFSGNAFRDGIGFETFYDQLVIALKVFRQFLFRKSLFPFWRKRRGVSGKRSGKRRKGSFFFPFRREKSPPTGRSSPPSWNFWRQGTACCPPGRSAALPGMCR